MTHQPPDSPGSRSPGPSAPGPDSPGPGAPGPDSPGPGARRRGGRRAGGSSSRQKILELARLAFPANGYAGTSLRGIARDAGVDPSLIVQLFGSKAGLFGGVVQLPF